MAVSFLNNTLQPDKEAVIQVLSFTVDVCLRNHFDKLYKSL